MSELSQTGERGRELTDAEWAQIERDVDMGYLSYDDAWRKLGVKPPSYQIGHAVDGRLSDQNIPTDKKPRPHQRSDLAAFDTRTGDAMLAYASEQEPSDDKWGEISRRGAAMARAAFRKARAA